MCKLEAKCDVCERRMGIASLVLLLCLGASQAQNWELVWEDEFDFLDLTKWDHEVTAWGGGNGEFQVYTPDPANSFIRDGKLVIKPTLTRDSIDPRTGLPFGEEYLYSGTMDLYELYGRCTNSNNYGCFREGRYGILPTVMSARLRSYQRFSFLYGKAEVIAKMPAGDYLWPAIWMLPEDWTYGGWPMSGEIDIMEGRGNRDLRHYGNSIGADHTASTLHWGPTVNQNRYYLTGAGKNDERNYVDYFHNYTMIWNENGFRFIMDGDEILNIPNPLIDQNPGWRGFYDFGGPWSPGTRNPWANARDTRMAPFDQRFHFILNVAVGGTNGYFPDDAVNRVNGREVRKPWRNWEGQQDVDFWRNNDLWLPTWDGDKVAMEVESVKVFREV